MARPDSDKYELTDAEKRDLTELIKHGKPLPEKFRFILFDDKREVELVWNGKSGEVSTAVLPFQTLEHIDEPRKEKKEDEEFSFDTRGRQQKGWTNKLIWGDNKLILSSLKSGALRRQIEEAGGLKLIYIDPPFDVGADFSMDIEIGGETFHKEANLLEQIAYRDTWGRGSDSFISMIYERLILMRDLLHDEGSIYVHLDWRVGHYVNLALEEIFGREKVVNTISWKRAGAHSHSAQGTSHFGKITDCILFCSKSANRIWTQLYAPYREEYISQMYRHIEEGTGRKYRLDNLTVTDGGPKGNPRYEFLGVTRYWRYNQQKMEKLYKEGRVIQTAPGRVPSYKRYSRK
jgi:site-specific DNA-methyltransferase (adenine-specific)/adenine-specific DNA-methyltransferase